MTCREKIAIEHPERIQDRAFGGVAGCPWEFGYSHRALCNDPAFKDSPFANNCIECWNQEAIEEKTDDVKSDYPKILDSGAVRDIQEGKGRCDLLPLDVVAEVLRDTTGKPDKMVNYIYLFQQTGDHDYLHSVINEVAYQRWPFPDECTMLLEVAKHFEEGCKKYGENNWQKGIPTHCYIDSAVRHYLKFLRGDKDEPHDRAFCWNILCCIWTCIHKPELNDYAKKESTDETQSVSRSEDKD